MKLLKNNKGFTLVELVMVIVILGILASVAVPKFTDLQSSAKEAAQAGVVGGVRSGIAVFAMGALAGALTVADSTDAAGFNGLGFPAQLDAQSGGISAALTPFFNAVLQQGGITDGSWSKTGQNVYLGPGADSSFTYDPAIGSFLLTP